MMKIHHIFFSILFYFSLILSSTAQVNSGVDDFMKSHIKSGFNGNVMYSKNDTIKFTMNCGLANSDSNEPLNDSSLFELGSVSKQFAALAIITLVESNKLSYDTEVDDIIKDFPYDKMTIEHLLQHRSGLPELFSFAMKHDVGTKEKIATNKDVLDAVIKYKPKLLFAPGTKHEYSNLGYIFLAVVIEEITGETYSQYIKKNLFVPAGMPTTDVILRVYNPTKIRNNTIAYTNKKLKKEATEKREFMFSLKETYLNWTYMYHNYNGNYGGCGISSSILEMELWKQAFRYNKIISETSKARFTKILLESGELGYGFSVNNFEEGMFYYHGGRWAGYTTESIYYPETNEYIVIMSNNDYSKTNEMAIGLIDLLIDK